MSDTNHPTADLCEWWPAEDIPATTVPGEGCDNRAVLSVGPSHRAWRLCESCAALPRFARLKAAPLDLMAALKASIEQARARRTVGEIGAPA